MNATTMLALFGAMVVLAAVPSVSVLTVTARAAASGFRHGLATAAGVVAGDIIFIGVAIAGLSVLAEAMGEWFALVRYLGAAYLVWFGLRLWRAGSGGESAPATKPASLRASFLSGLLLTLADQKAIFFYLGFFPAFVNLEALSTADALVVVAIAVVAVGGVKTGYAWLAGRAGALASGPVGRGINRAAGGVMVGVGVYLAAKS